MTRSFGSVFAVFCLALSSLVVVPAAQAQNNTLFLDDRVGIEAAAVINGTVVSVFNVELDGMPFTVHEINVTSVLSGTVPEMIYVEIRGGTRSDGAEVRLSTSADFLQVDETVQLAMKPAAEVVASTVALSVSKPAPVYSIVRGELGVAALEVGGLQVDRAVGDYAFIDNTRPSFRPAARYRVDARHSGLSEAATTQAVRKGFDRWEDDAGSLVDFTYEGTTSAGNISSTYYNGRTDVSWQWPDIYNDFDVDTLAVAFSFKNDGQDWEFEIALNRHVPWSVGAVPGHYDIETVVAHEVGHGIGLAHVPTAPEELMFPYSDAGVVKELGSGDRAGARVIYPDRSPITEPGHSVDSNRDGDFVVLGLKADGKLFARRALDGSWSAWQPLGAGGWASADVTISPFGTVQVAAIKRDGRLFTQRWTRGGNWTGWVFHGNGWDPNATPSISSNSRRTFLGAVTANGALRTKVYEGSWSGPTTHGASTWTQVDVDIAADGDLWFAGTKLDGRLLLRKHLGSGWSGYGLMGAATWDVETPPAIAARSNGVVFAAVKIDGRLYTREQVAGRWRGYIKHGLWQWNSVDIAMTQQGVKWLAATKNTGQLYTREQIASGSWRGWQTQGSATWSPHADPSVSIVGDDVLLFAAAKADNALFLRAGRPNDWTRWLQLGAGRWATGL